MLRFTEQTEPELIRLVADRLGYTEAAPGSTHQRLTPDESRFRLYDLGPRFELAIKGDDNVERLVGSYEKTGKPPEHFLEWYKRCVSKHLIPNPEAVPNS